MGENKQYAQAELYATLADNPTGVVWTGLRSAKLSEIQEYTGDAFHIDLGSIEGTVTFEIKGKLTKVFNRYMRRCSRIDRRFKQQTKRQREKEKKKWRTM